MSEVLLVYHRIVYFRDVSCKIHGWGVTGVERPPWRMWGTPLACHEPCKSGGYFTNRQLIPAKSGFLSSLNPRLPLAPCLQPRWVAAFTAREHLEFWGQTLPILCFSTALFLDGYADARSYVMLMAGGCSGRVLSAAQSVIAHAGHAKGMG